MPASEIYIQATETDPDVIARAAVREAPPAIAVQPGRAHQGGADCRQRTAAVCGTGRLLSHEPRQSDSTHFGAFDQNIFTEWHSRYGGRGVLICWHVERKSMAIHSQVINCSASRGCGRRHDQRGPANDFKCPIQF